jgi:hypothetical protein
MTQLIFTSDHSPADGPTWTVTQQPGQTTSPHLVEFVKRGRASRLLDQVALWDPIARQWSANRWVPKPPTVPKWLLAKVEAHMQRVAA